jgi:nucleotide-binding universal stress UspA family protein
MAAFCLLELHGGLWNAHRLVTPGSLALHKIGGLMIKTILVPVGSAGIKSPSFRAAVWLARTFTGHIDVLYARPDPVAATAVYPGAFIPDMSEQLEAAADREHAEALKAYLGACESEQIPTDVEGPARGRVTARWHRETGRVARSVAAHGRTADLLVAEHPSSGDPLIAEALEAALFDSGRPVLVAGLKPPSLEKVAIAWKATREAARAVNAALPLLARAKQVVILSAAESSGIDRNATDRLIANLQRHHPAVESLLLESPSSDIGADLLIKADQIQAGLLIMGAYSRPRMRELVFGGVTERVLRGADVSILMAH